MIAESVNRMFSERLNRQRLSESEAGVWAGDLWQLIEDSGLCGLLSSEAGDGESAWQNAYPVFHAIGFHQLPLPLAETIVANALLELAGLGQQTGTIALIEQAGQLELRREGERLFVNGSARSVPWARVAGNILVSGYAEGMFVLGLVQAAAEGVKISPADSIAGEARDTVSFENTPCSRYAVAEGLAGAAVTRMCALARAAQMVGAAESVLQQSIQYANDRVQFGKPIGKYQAIQQALAVLAGEIACARTATLSACRTTAIVPSEFDVAVAKIRAGQMAAAATSIGHEVHGAFGYTHEHTLHFATRRLWAWRAEYGGESSWAAPLGREAIQRGGGAFWSMLTLWSTHGEPTEATCGHPAHA